MKIAVCFALIAVLQIIIFNTIVMPSDVISQYVVLLALCLSLYTGISIRE